MVFLTSCNKIKKEISFLISKRYFKLIIAEKNFVTKKSLAKVINKLIEEMLN